MPWNKTTWENQEGTGLNRFQKANEVGNFVELTRAPLSVTKAGTAFTAARMNNLETGIENAIGRGAVAKGVNNGTFNSLSQTSRQWNGMTTLGSDVYACALSGDIYKQTGGTGDFLPLSQTNNWFGMTTLGNDVYACVYNGDIYKQTNGTGNFLPLSQTSRQWTGMTTLGGDVYACVNNGDIYKQTGGTGNFLPLGQTSRFWRGMTTLGNDVYAPVYNGDIYKQTGGTGNFLPLGQTSRFWTGMTTLGGDVYACVNNGDIYKQTNGTGNFLPLSQTSRNWFAMTILGDDVYACVNNGDIYKSLGTAVGTIGETAIQAIDFVGTITLPAGLPIGTRKRIRNISSGTVTIARAGSETLDGGTSIAIATGAFADVEKTTSTAWLVKYGFDNPQVNPNSGLVFAAGSNLPEYPDDPAGTTYKNVEGWTTGVDGWAAIGGGAAPTIVSGVMRFVKSGANQYVRRAIAQPAGATLRVKVRHVAGSGNPDAFYLRFLDTTYSPATVNIPSDGSWAIVEGITAVGGANLGLCLGTVGSANTYSVEFQFIYIGTGAYLPGSLLDQSGNGNHATVFGATPDGQGGLIGDGVNDNVSLFAGILGVSFSIDFWLKLNSAIGANVTIVNKRQPAGYTYEPFRAEIVTNGSLSLVVADSVTTRAFPSSGVGAGAIVVGAWNKLTFTYGAGVLKTYFNGVQTASVAVTISDASSLVEMLSRAASAYVPGTIRHPRIYNRALSAAEVWELYQNPDAYNLDRTVRSISPVPNSGVQRGPLGMIQLATHTPASATATGTVGQFAYDANYLYICTATNTWKRAPIAAW